MKPVTIAILGAGSRGLDAYAPYALKEPGKCQIVAVADPLPERRRMAVERFGIAPDRVFQNWEEFVTHPKMCDAVIIATQDAMHTAPAVACAGLGYDILLEKPISTNAAECREIVASVKANRVIFAVGFVLRYTAYFRKLRELIHSGAIGELVSFRHLERVAYWHQAHSFVRGAWRNKAESSPMILAKCSHDMDILNYLIGSRCEALSSQGGLAFFNAAHKPAGATARCLDCPLRESCLYSAARFYFGKLHAREWGWPLNVLTSDFTASGVERALRHGPYGRCVFDCDNDVVDHQVVAFRYGNGVSGSMTMTAFTADCCRHSEFFGTHGEIRGDGNRLTVQRFGGIESTTYDMNAASNALDGGHGGGDAGLARDFVEAVARRDQSVLGCTPDEVLDGHLMALAAEEARLENTVISL